MTPAERREFRDICDWEERKARRQAKATRAKILALASRDTRREAMQPSAGSRPDGPQPRRDGGTLPRMDPK